jgi:hypothetical protein
MPSRSTHVGVAVPLGAGFALHKTRNKNGLEIILEGVGGALGGMAGGVLPDILEPPDSSWHRSTAHAALPVAMAAAFWSENLDTWQTNLRLLADQHRGARSQTTDVLAACWHAFVEWMLRLLAGSLAGFGAGYLSHVALDLRTPRCVPLVS